MFNFRQLFGKTKYFWPFSFGNIPLSWYCSALVQQVHTESFHGPTLPVPLLQTYSHGLPVRCAYFRRKEKTDLTIRSRFTILVLEKSIETWVNWIREDATVASVANRGYLNWFRKLKSMRLWNFDVPPQIATVYHQICLVLFLLSTQISQRFIATAEKQYKVQRNGHIPRRAIHFE